MVPLPFPLTYLRNTTNLLTHTFFLVKNYTRDRFERYEITTPRRVHPPRVCLSIFRVKIVSNYRTFYLCIS